MAFSLLDLESVIAARAGADPAASYTAGLLAAGPQRSAKKLGEEAVEVVIAAVAGDGGELVGESADLLFHLLVVLRALGVPVREVMDELERRTAQSGIEEKASRGR
jgi:phosphoribosyl-ATP pyrophosphohydrolase